MAKNSRNSAVTDLIKWWNNALLIYSEISKSKGISWLYHLRNTKKARNHMVKSIGNMQKVIKNGVRNPKISWTQRILGTLSEWFHQCTRRSTSKSWRRTSGSQQKSWDCITLYLFKTMIPSIPATWWRTGVRTILFRYWTASHESQPKSDLWRDLKVHVRAW